jgi:ATP-dependent RNA helicase DDX23/PRP28
VATSFLTNEDTEIMYDLKEMLTRTGNIVPAELAAHESSKVKPGTIVTKRRRDTIIFAR